MRGFAVILILLFYSCKQKIVFPEGGLDYPTTVTAKDSSFCMYQYRDSLSSLDSLKAANFSRWFQDGFNEPNLSIRPLEQVTFRLFYDEWSGQQVVITLTENSLVIKQNTKGHIDPYFDYERLTADERHQLSLSDWYFQLKEEERTSPRYILYVDSFFRLHPRLNDISYYQDLQRKASVYDTVPFQYTRKSIPISKRTFIHLVNLINASGFWNMPKESDCEDIPADGAGFVLEANTPTKYKIVTTASCPNDNRKFTKACQELIKHAGLDNKIRLIWDYEIKKVDTATIELRSVEIDTNLKGGR